MAGARPAAGPPGGARSGRLVDPGAAGGDQPAIAEAAGQGVRQTDLVKITGYTRERIRQICRAG
jgi:hypothetical protein